MKHLASELLHADFFGKRVKMGVMTFMNHGGNREILFIDLCGWHWYQSVLRGAVGNLMNIIHLSNKQKKKASRLHVVPIAAS